MNSLKEMYRAHQKAQEYLDKARACYNPVAVSIELIHEIPHAIEQDILILDSQILTALGQASSLMILKGRLIVDSLPETPR